MRKTFAALFTYAEDYTNHQLQGESMEMAILIHFQELMPESVEEHKRKSSYHMGIVNLDAIQS